MLHWPSLEKLARIEPVGIPTLETGVIGVWVGPGLMDAMLVREHAKVWSDDWDSELEFDVALSGLWIVVM